MGAELDDEIKKIEKLKCMDEDVRLLLGHHFRNSLTGIIGGLQTGELKLAEDSAWHMVKDLEKFGL